MSSRWWRRAGAVVAVWLVVYVISEAGGTGPRPLLIGVFLCATASVLWLAVDLAEHVTPAQWDTGGRSTAHRRGADVRVGVLQRALDDVVKRQDVAHLHPLLVDLVDDRLLAHHGVDRERDPRSARAVLGDELADFVTTPPSPVQLSNHRDLARILTLVEAL
jgi:hypothetical protein